jgi:RND superfamily putative drug exporter
MGDANWWAPGPLRRLHDRIGFSETGPAAVPVQRSTLPAREPVG